MNKIQKFSASLLCFSNLLLVALPLIIIIKWLFIDTNIIQTLMTHGLLQNQMQTPEGYTALSAINWTPFLKTIGFSAQAIEILPIFLSLFVLKCIFQNYKKGEIFSTLNAANYRYLGLIFFLHAIIAKPLCDSLMVLAITMSNPPGHRYLTLGFGTPNITVVFCGIIVMVISWIMLEASKLKEEQKFTI